MSDPASPAGETQQVLSRVAMVAAVALLVVYLVVVILQWRDVGADDVSWNRRQTLLTGLEALAFAGAGALFGTAVQRQVTIKVERQAAEAERVAESAQRDAEKGRALHAAIAAKAAAPAEQLDVERGRGQAPGGPGYDELLAVAEQYDER